MSIQERINQLEEFIVRHKEFNRNEEPDAGAKDANLQWRVSLLLARLLEAAKGNYYYIDTKSLEIFQSKYNTEHQTSININKLHSKHWLRSVLGKVRIAGKISSDLHEFERLQSFLPELQFLLEAEKKYKLEEKDTATHLTQDIIEKEIAAFQLKHGKVLNKDGIYYNRWYNENEKKFSSLDIYFKRFSENAAEYSFLLELSNIISSETHLFITEQDATRIHDEHKKQNSLTPSLEKLLNDQLLLPTDGGYHLHVRAGYWSELKDEISGFFWENLLLNTINTDLQSIIIWSCKIIHFDHIVDPISFVTSSSAKRFLDAALECLLQESDLDDVERERKKLFMEQGSGQPYSISFIERAPYLSGEDIFALYKSLDALDNYVQHNLLHHQPSRYSLLGLVQIIVKNDDKYINTGNPDQIYYLRVTSLLDRSITKPYLLFQTTESILYTKPQILPYLMVESRFASLALLLLDKLQTDKEENTRLTLWKLSVTLTITVLNENNIQGETAAIFIFRLLLLINNRKRRRAMSVTYQDEENKTIFNLLENQSIGTCYGDKTTNLFLLPTLFDHLAKLLMAFQESEQWETSTVSFPIFKWYGLSWLLKLYFDIRYTHQMADKGETAHLIALSFLESYKGLMKLIRKKTYNYFEFKFVEKEIHWSEDCSDVGTIQWLYLVVQLHNQGKHAEFILPDLEFQIAKDKYDLHNRIIAQKIRTHIVVLLELLKQLREPSSQMLFENTILEVIADKTESAIIYFLQNHTHKPLEGKFDVLEEMRGLSHDEPLIVKLAKSMYGFNRHSELVHVIVDSGDAAKLLTLLDHVTSESLRAAIIQQVSTQNIDKILRDYHWIPDVKHILVRLIKYPELAVHAEKAIEYWANEISERKVGDYKETLYEVQLFHSYLKKDQSALESAQPLKGAFEHHSALTASDYKDFYLGLLLIEKEPLRAYHLFDSVYSRKPNLVTFGVNRTVAQLNHLKFRGNATLTDIQEAYQEWTILRDKLEETTVKALEPEITSIQMSLLVRLKQYAQADKKFEQLPDYQKYTQQITTIQVQSLQERGKVNDALNLIAKADEFHYYPGIPQAAFITILKDQLTGIDNVEELQISMLRILEVEPDKLVKIIPSAINEKREPVSFIVKEILIACSKMLDKIQAIEKINSEDKYNDLVEVLLNARIAFYNWRVKDQSRGAYSGTAKDAGERDLSITDKNDQMLLLCEAFILRDQAQTTKHLQKVFNYHHRRHAFCILVYDTHILTGSFEDHWNDYLTIKLPGVVFPAGFELIGAANDISKNFYSDLSAIRVATTHHAGGTILYHVFVNIQYQLSTKP